MSLSQGLYQKQLQKLSPQQIQMLKLLVLPAASMEERINQELEENPALEIEEKQDEFDGDEMKDEFESNENEDDFEIDGSQEEYDNVNIEEYVTEGDDEIADYKTKDNNYPEINDKQSLPFKMEEGLQEFLFKQLHEQDLNEKEIIIAEQIIGSLDDDGYLRRDLDSLVDDLAFRQNLNTNLQQVEKILKLVQTFEPSGIAARNLQECLLIQMDRMDKPKPNHQLTVAILKNHFDDFSNKKYEKIKKRLNVTDEDLKQVVHNVVHLSPKPGGNISANATKLNYLIPDFYVTNNNGKLELTLSQSNIPSLKISDEYKEMLQHYESGKMKDSRQKDAAQFIRYKIDGAKNFIDAIKQRQNTLMLTMEAIVQYQKEFFLTGDESTLKPMLLKDIAAITNFDISTISRVANSKYVQTEFGNFKLRYFFNEAFETQDGEEVSSRDLKRLLLELIENEDKKNPLNDDELNEKIEEQGFTISRRTVAKYREQLNIPVARLRKTL